MRREQRGRAPGGRRRPGRSAARRVRARRASCRRAAPGARRTPAAKRPQARPRRPCRRPGWPPRRPSRGNGSTPAPASAPNSAAEITLPFASAMRLHVEADDALGRDARRRRPRPPGSAMPLPGRSFSTTAKARCVEAISVVRSGVTRPRSMERPASMNSAASTTSTSPGVGIRAKTGRRPVARRQHLDVVDRGAGALRDARHGGRLRGPAFRLGQGHDPVRQHAAALPAHGQDGDGERPVGGEAGGIGRSSGMCDRGSSPSPPATAKRG